MREVFLEQMATLSHNLERLGKNVAKAMSRATRALQQQDYVLAEQTIDADECIDEISEQIDESCVQLLALQAPVATDLRFVVASLRLSQTLERQGDLAKHVAQIARSAYPNAPTPNGLHVLICRMADQASRVAELEAEMIKNNNVQLARQIQDEDDRLDELQVEVHRMAVNPATELSPQQVVDAVMLGRFLERFGDHATSAARRVEFLVKGQAFSK